jgi:hypothetical protein
MKERVIDELGYMKGPLEQDKQRISLLNSFPTNI